MKASPLPLYIPPTLLSELPSLGTSLPSCAECDVSVSKLFYFLDGFGFGTVKIVIGKSIGFGIVKIWFQRKIWIRFRSDVGYFG